MGRDIEAAGTRGRCAIAVMAKASEPGRTKTRLAPPLTPAEAAALNTAFLKDIADKLLDAGREARCRPMSRSGLRGRNPSFARRCPAELA